MVFFKKRFIVIVCLFSLIGSTIAYTIPVIDAQLKANLRSIKKRGGLIGRIVGKMGQWGDSITNSMAYLGSLAGYGCSGNTTCETYQPILIWMKACETSPGSGIVGGGCSSPLAEKGGGHCCESGWTIESGLNVIARVIEQDNPSWSLTMYGTNDINGNNWDDARGETYKRRLKYFLLASAEAGIPPAVSTIPPRMDGCNVSNDYTPSVTICNNKITAAANELKIPLVDFHYACVEHHPSDWCGGTTGTLGDDGVHPSWHSNTTNFDPPAIYNDGYAIRGKLTLDYAQRLKAIVFDNNAPDGLDLPIIDVSSSTHLWGQYTNNSSVSFSWTLDGGSTPTGYSYVFDQVDTTMPDQTSEGTGVSATETATSSGDWYFHIRANSAPVTHYLVRILPADQMVLQEGMNGYSGTADASIYGETSHGSDAIMRKYNSGGSGDRQLYRFSLAPAVGLAVTGAQLQIFTDSPANGDSVALYKLTASWGEGYSVWNQQKGVSWTYRFADSTQAWTTAGGDFEHSPIGATALPTDRQPTWVSFDITSTVQGWLADTSTNHGVIIIGYGAWLSTSFFSREFPLKSLRPKLLLTHTGSGVQENMAMAQGIALGQPYPNPGNPGVVIPVTLAPSARVQVSVYSVKGELLKKVSLANTSASPRREILRWDAIDMTGSKVSSGLYLARMKTDDGTVVIKRFVITQ